MVTIKDVARESGVAISTVSNVLNHVDVVSEETKRKVLEAAHKLNYVPNMNAKFLKTNKKNTVGLFLPSIQGDFYKMLMQAVHLRCKLQGYLLNIYVSNENTSEEIYSMIISSGVEGAIVLNEGLSDQFIERIRLTGLPVVFIDREIEGKGISSVIIDNTVGAALAMEYLIKQGHRRIGYIHGIHNYDDEARFGTYVNVLNKYSLPVDEAIILRGYFEEAVAYSEMRVLLLKKIPLPDAVFCANDEMAWGCIRALTEAGIRVPEAVSVMGFDDNTLAAYYKPALTTVHSPVTELGNISAEEIIRLMKGHEGIKGTIHRLNPELILRESCAIKL
ncbi:LacI family transcriptional regulator [Anaerocolumna cellulosilytica]|uniref:LacI family transcriptional regulator n=1 Tax=Anaerocolumna cellulosilytica TaxID=433286 RepID=A0A6S6R1V4_9FIRM|nr:LacI family DNA-binding transcriptional regulator [Anaerocolumna cellulosilytica]MBB5195076.1 LacI family purine nucleotide synthesis repressor [Anaerocolumna cellulosilytica]BCJ96086.1 LacI family transcriptional regulator [Anaerocolumna cellulosilytica]